MAARGTSDSGSKSIGGVIIVVVVVMLVFAIVKLGEKTPAGPEPGAGDAEPAVVVDLRAEGAGPGGEEGGVEPELPPPPEPQPPPEEERVAPVPVPPPPSAEETVPPPEPVTPAPEEEIPPPAPPEEAEPAEEEPEPAPTLTIQAGAYKDRKYADFAVEVLKTAGLQPRIRTGETAGGSRIHRVQVGSFSARGDAERALQRVKDLGYSDAFIKTLD